MAVIRLANGGGNYDSTGTWDGGVVPGSGDTIILDGSSGNLTVNTFSMCLNLTCSDYVGTLTFSASQALVVVGNLTFSAGMTVVVGSGSIIRFLASSTGKTITTAGKSVGTLQFQGSGGGWTLQDALTAVGIEQTYGTFATNDQTVTLQTWKVTGTQTKAITLGSSVITVTGNAASFDWSASTASTTFTPGTSTIKLTGTGLAPAFGNRTFYDLEVNTTGGFTNNYFITVHDIDLTGTDATTCSAMLAYNMTVSNAFTVAGFSGAKRVLVYSNTTGTARTITAASVSLTNADFADITASGASSPWSGTLLGDRGGNTNITTTTPTTQTWTNANGGNWSDVANWSSHVPLPQDTASMACAFGTAKTVTIDHPIISTVDWTGATWTTSLTWSQSIDCYFYGSLTMIAGLTVGSGNTWFFVGRGSYAITSAGVQTGRDIQINAYGGTYTLQDAVSTTLGINVATGSFVAGAYNVTCATFIAGGTLSSGSGTWTLTGTGNVMSGTGAISLADSTIVVSNTTATSKTFVGNSKTYGNITVSGNAVTITGNNTFKTLAVNTAGHATGLKLFQGNTQTITGMTTNGSDGSLAKMASFTNGATHTLSKASGVVSVDYMSIRDSIAQGGALWYAGDHSTDVSGNTGWVFTGPNVAPVATLTVNGVVGSTVNVTPAATDVDGTIVSLVMEWGDGDSDSVTSGVPVDHLYSNAGTYGMTLTATDDLGATDTDTANAVVANTAPICSFTVSQTSKYVRVVNANASSDPDGGVITAWRCQWETGGAWEAGVVGVALTHDYGAPGTYDITVEVTDDEATTATDSYEATLVNPLPVPTLTLDSAVGLTVWVTPSAVDDSAVADLTVDWGDGTAPDAGCVDGVSISHVYALGGGYTVTLTATDDEADTATDTVAVTAVSVVSSAPISYAVGVGGMGLW